MSLELKYVCVIGIGEELLGWEKCSCEEEKKREMIVFLNICINYSLDVF